jgi:hypothetical protein
MSISLGIDVGAVSVKLAALSSREDCALLARVAEASPASRGVLSVMAWLRKLSRRLSQPGFPCYGITSCLPVIHSEPVDG